MSYTALVTGACTNTGVDIVNKLLEEGCRVVFTGRDAEKVAATEERYRARFPESEVFGYALDSLTDERTVDVKSVKALFARLDQKGWSVNALVLNAADQGLNMKIFENPVTDFQKVLNTNVSWNYVLCEEAAHRMKEKDGGSITFINSNTAYRAIPDRIAYEASKGAQLGMMRGLAFDLGKFGIRVNAVLPGMIRTDRWVKNPDFYRDVPSRFTPLGDVADGTDIADAVWYFVSAARNTTGAELVVDGGNMIQLYPVIPNNPATK